MNNRWRRRLKSGPLQALYRVLRNTKRHLRGEALSGTVPVEIKPLLYEELTALAATLPNSPRLYYSLALRLLANISSNQKTASVTNQLQAAQSEAAQVKNSRIEAAQIETAWAHLVKAWELGFESPERLALYFGLLLSIQERRSEAVALTACLTPNELTDEEEALRQQILHEEPAKIEWIGPAGQSIVQSSEQPVKQLIGSLARPLIEQPEQGRGGEAGRYNVPAFDVGCLQTTYAAPLLNRSARPRVTVIVPNYNYARFLKERLRSILHQTVTDFELLYVDDASHDQSNAIAESFAADHRMVLTCYTTNSGSVYNRRRELIERAQGEWVWFAEADDSADISFLEKLLALADRYPTAGILHCRMITIDTAGTILGMGRNWRAFPELDAHLAQDYFAAGHEEALRLTSTCYLSSSSGILLRRQALLDCGGYDTRLKVAADWDLYLRILQKVDIAYTVQPLAFYRTHDTSVSRATQGIERGLEDAFCIAAAYRWMQEDSRFTSQEKEGVRRCLKSRVFDIFVSTQAKVPAELKFAADYISAVCPNKRFH